MAGGKVFVALVLSALAFGASAQTTANPGDLGPGSPAPAITVSKWVKGSPVKSFEKGKVYVVEFWATWCGPCKESIPHLTELQKKHKGKATFIGVSAFESDQKLVEPFVKQMGASMDYTVAMDKVPESGDGGDGVMATRWMKAAAQDGIPTAFIIDRQGKIAWIGHPMEMEQPLDQVIAGKWDLAAYKLAEQGRQDKMRQMRSLNQRLIKAVDAKEWDAVASAADDMNKISAPSGYSAEISMLARAKEYDRALNALDAMQKDQKYASLAADWRFSLLITAKRYDEAYAYGRELLNGLFKDSDESLNSVAWLIVSPDEKIDKPDLDLALAAAKRSIQIRKSSANLDTLARVYWLKGDKAQAVATQKEALSLAPASEKAGLQKTLDTYGG